MHGGGKSDEAIVAVKPANAAEQSAAELVEPRAEAKGNAARQSTYRTQRRVDVSPAPDRIRHRARGVSFGPEIGAVCGKAARTDLCGGRSAMSVPTATAAKSGSVRRAGEEDEREHELKPLIAIQRVRLPRGKGLAGQPEASLARVRQRHA